MVTIKEVAELAGVSQATVSRVMNGSDRVSDQTRQKVKSAMTTLGYQPNSAAQSLASSRSNTLGMVVASLDGPFYGPMMSGIEEELRLFNKHVIIASGHGTEEGEKEAIQYLSNRQVDGLILLTECLNAEYLFDLNNKIPIYLINQHIDGLEKRNMWLDNKGGTYTATRYLIDKGHQKIVYVGGQTHKQDANERVEGFVAAMTDANLAIPDGAISRTLFEVEGGQKGIEMIHQQGIPFTAVVAGSDEMAIGVYEWASNQGLSVPEDISVIGFDDVNLASYIRPRLTTMNFPAYQMARTCARMAVDELYNKLQPHGMEFKPNLVVRGSVQSLKG
ncbi:LacI family DNA-binding transcriptional regulator [Reinekea marina]|uniref:LacI family DNA-binding transcriptional regulator n=1 Tax=Reinekea marina TaxID=1310421 RepID=A0ABV7WNW4_9GAMM|nr:LacI family DNA-binding transcriptional regulator [Reinekea marina]MDN3647908.1 LacI family DNA-binding transcriptional regulator [Reinekea marina]